MNKAADLFNPLVPKAHNRECQNLPFLLQNKPEKSVKTTCQNFIFYTLGINGLSEYWTGHGAYFNRPHLELGYFLSEIGLEVTFWAKLVNRKPQNAQLCKTNGAPSA